MSKPRFSILSMLLMMSVAGLALALFLSRQKVSQLGRALEKSVQTERYLRDELGTIDADDGNLYVKELENQVPLVRRYRVLFPQGNYRVVAGSFLGGEFSPENVREEVGATIHLKMSTELCVRIHADADGNAGFHVNTIDFTSGQTTGGNLKHKIDIVGLSYSDEQHSQAMKWRFKKNRPHGDLLTLPSGTKFIPLFIHGKWVTLQDENGTAVETSGLAFWIEPSQ